MKKLILFIFLFTYIPVFAQSQFVTHTLTSGHVDKNPVFASSYYPAQPILLGMEYLTFERHSGSNSQICVILMGPYGVLGQLTQITNATSLKRNPAICYNSLYGFGGSITHALAVWEDYRNGKWDLYASSFSTSWGWSTPYAFDTDQYDKSNVKIIGKDSVIFYIVYEKNNDVIYRKFNSRTATILEEVNLTSSNPAVCGKPAIVYCEYLYNFFLVTYEKTKADTKKAVYFRKRSSSGVWSAPDTAAYAGNNMNTGFAANNFLYPEMTFDSDRSGKYKMYVTLLNPNGTKDQYLVSNLQQYSHYNYNHFQSFFFPILTDNTYFMVASYIRKSDVTKLFCIGGAPTDSTLLGDSSLSVKSSINNGITTVISANVWIAYAKDSLSFSNVYAKQISILISDVKNIGTGVPEVYSLYQNYPNPFNSKTVIKFAIPKAGDVRLRVFDALGREIAVLVNEHLPAGVYETSFDASGYASGVYYYELKTGSFAETKMMVYVK